MSSSEKDLSRKDLNNILPSFMLNEVESIKSDNEEKKSKFSEEFNLLNSPFNNSEPKSKNGSAHPSSPNDSKSMECNKDSPKDESIETSQNYNINKFTQNNQNNIDDIYEAKTEFNSIINDANKNYGKNNLIKDINKNYSLSNLNFNCENFLNGVNINSNIEYLCHNNYNNKLYNSNFDDKYKINYTSNGDIYLNNNMNLNNIMQQNKLRIIPFLNNYINNEAIYQNKIVNIEYDSNFKKNKFNVRNNNIIMQNIINKNLYSEGNIINNYFNNINNFNIIENNFINNSNYINNFTNNSYSFPNQSYFQKENNIYNLQINNKNLDDFVKYINSLPMPLVNFLCTQRGTLEIQKRLDKLSKEYKVLLVNLLGKQGLHKIMKNIYGNYFFQQLIKNKDKSFIELIIAYIEEDLIEISKDFQGTFCVQALIDEISSLEEEQKILNCIKNYEMEMAFNKNATHVLQKIVLLFPDKHRLYLNDIILNNFIALCLDSNGICLIKIFIKTNTLVSNKNRINEKVANNFILLAESPYGNYGVQYLMELWKENELKDFGDKIIENIQELSLQQFSSNVVEKAIEVFNNQNRENILQKLCFNNKLIINLINNKFGKFVLNKAIKFMKVDMINEFEAFLNKDINDNIYKGKDKNKIKKLITKLKNSKKTILFTSL
jgi:hypothetical protein